jgi:hypothetical protein
MMKDSDSVADSSSLIASLMEATGSPIENATLALQKCGGNKQKALELLLTGGGANFNDKQQSVSAGASKGAKLDENVEITKASMAQQDTGTHKNVLYSFLLSFIESRKSNWTHILRVSASTAAAARGSQSTASVMRERGVPTPRPAQTTIFPGAVAVEGPGARGTDDQRTLSFTSSSGSNSMSNQPTEVKSTVTARLVIDNSEDHFESLEERIQRVEELQRRQEGIVIGQVLGADNEDGDEEEARSVASSNEDVTSLRASLFGSKRKMTIAVVLVLAVVAIIVGSVIATSSSNSQKDEAPPTAAPASTLSDLIELLSSVSFDNGTALQTRLTPQNDALNWLASNANLDTYSDEKRIQRYALAVLYYSTNGDSWYGKVGWLSNFDECDWYSLAEAGSLCDENGSVVELNFYNGDTETGNNEVGTIPIGNGNNIVGTIPNELALLSDSLGNLFFGSFLRCLLSCF